MTSLFLKHAARVRQTMSCVCSLKRRLAYARMAVATLIHVGACSHALEFQIHESACKSIGMRVPSKIQPDDGSSLFSQRQHFCFGIFFPPSLFFTPPLNYEPITDRSRRNCSELSGMGEGENSLPLGRNQERKRPSHKE